MKLKTFLSLTAVAALYFGVVGLFLQAKALQIYGMASEPGNLWQHNLMCAALIALGTMALLGRKLQDDAALRLILIVGAVHAAPSALIVALGIVNGLANALAWSMVAVNVLILGGALYFLGSRERRAQ